MSHLYTMFAKQVHAYCKTNTPEHSMKPQCKRELLLHGLGNLNKMDETHLDSMDPYQRGATDIGKFHRISRKYFLLFNGTSSHIYITIRILLGHKKCPQSFRSCSTLGSNSC